MKRLLTDNFLIRVAMAAKASGVPTVAGKRKLSRSIIKILSARAT